MISNQAEDRGIRENYISKDKDWNIYNEPIHIKYNIIKKDITSVDKGILCNQTNCQAVMGSGVALALKRKFPNLESEYIDFCKRFSSPSALLGQIQTVKVGEHLYVANLFGQEMYGYNGGRFTSYGAWEQALPSLKKDIDSRGVKHLPVYFPYLVGADRGGGNFIILAEMIKEYFPKVIFCKL